MAVTIPVDVPQPVYQRYVRLNEMTGVPVRQLLMQALVEGCTQRSKVKVGVDHAAVIAAYESGMSVSECATRFGVSDEGVRYHLRRSGVQLRGKRLSLDVDRVRELWEQGLTDPEIAEALCAKPTTVYKTSRYHLGLPAQRRREQR